MIVGDELYIVSAVRGAMGPGDVVFARAPGVSFVVFGVAVVVAVVEVAVVAGSAAFAVELEGAGDASAVVGGIGDKLGGASTG
jgi:hypothetical protein